MAAHQFNAEFKEQNAEFFDAHRSAIRHPVTQLRVGLVRQALY